VGGEFPYFEAEFDGEGEETGEGGGGVGGGCDMINIGGRGICDVMLRDGIKVVGIVDWQLECGW
jgi:hypothetical protein